MIIAAPLDEFFFDFSSPFGLLFIAIISIPLLIVVAVVFFVIRADLRARRVVPRPITHCPQCGYDLRATPARCPECGAAPLGLVATADQFNSGDPRIDTKQHE